MDGAPDRYKPLEDYAIIGDLRTVALVGLDGSIDFLCFPDFDSPSIFAALLDVDKGGRFQIAPVRPATRTYQLYLPDTNVLLTRFLSHEGVAELTDLMPVCLDDDQQALVRQVRVVRGEVEFHMALAPRFDYARAEHTLHRHDSDLLFVSRAADGLALRLRASCPVTTRGGDVIARFTLRAGQTASFVLERVLPGQDSPFTSDDVVEREFNETVQYWRQWLSGSSYAGRWREMVHRSALVLKLLSSRKYGSIIAAPTFGIPEWIKGARNWDYRYTWIRDASFTIKALLQLGFTEEASAFMQWLERACRHLDTDVPIQVMYGLDGSRNLREEELAHLEGYRGTKPVLIGNRAHAQLQLDIYGELLDAVYLSDQHDMPVHYDMWSMLVRAVDWVCEHWQQRDHGIWESRGGKHEFLHSRVMCWVALDRALRIAQRRSLPGPIYRWMEVRDQIYHGIYETMWSPALKAFVMYPGASVLDGASLMMPLVGFISPTEPRWLTTLTAIGERLVEDSLVYRYKHDLVSDGIQGQEGTFSVCTFWYAECLALAGDIDHARLVFEKMLGYANHVGLYGEELSPCADHLGNFPQAFTHLGLINAAMTLDRILAAARRP